MKYAIILVTKSGSYLLGFTNTSFKQEDKDTVKYTVELKEMDSIFVPLVGDASVYLS